MKVRIKKLPQARTGYQVQGSLANDVPAMGGADFNAYIGMPKPRVSKNLTAIPKEKANLEAEGGETVYGDINGDNMAEHYTIKGPRHAQGGVPLKLPDDSFIYSDFRGMSIKDPIFLQMFGKGSKGKKSYTPAELAKQYDINKYRQILQDPDSDHIDRKTAELMIKNYQMKLAALALVQEAKKGFPQGMPAVAKPITEKNQFTEDTFVDPSIKQFASQVDTKIKQGEEEQNTADQDVDYSQQLAQAQEMNQGEPIAQEQPMSPDMEQGMPPMAQYGMSIGGFDVPFSEDMPAAKYGMSMEEYDLPEAEYGMAMGINSRNYMGRPKSPMYARGGALRTYKGDEDGSSTGPTGGAAPGNDEVLDISNMDDYHANIALYAWRKKHKDKEPKIMKDGKQWSYTPPGKKDRLTMDELKAVNDAGYKWLETELKDPNSKVRAELLTKAKEAYENPASYGSSTFGKKAYKDRKPLSEIKDDEFIDNMLKGKKRNDKIKESNIDVNFLSNDGTGFESYAKLKARGAVTSLADYNAIKKEYHDKGWDTRDGVANATGITLPTGNETLLEQSMAHGLALMQGAKNKGAYNNYSDEDAYKIDALLGTNNSKITNTGAADESEMGRLYGAEFATLSPMDNYAGNSHLAQGINPSIDQGKFVGPPEDKKDDKPCEPCQRADGSSYVPVKNADGTCAECTQETVPGEKPEPKMWLQDKIKTFGALTDLMSAKKYQPWTAKYSLQTPTPRFLDPTRELAANAEQANIQSQALAQFAGPQQLSARASGIMGASSKNAADILSKYNNANVNIDNQFRTNYANIKNQEQSLNTAATQKLYDQNTIANQQFDNTTRALRGNLRNQTTAGITNMMKTAALNYIYPNFYVDPSDGGDVTIDPSKARDFKPGSTADTEAGYYAECSKRFKSEETIQNCVNTKMKYSGSGAGTNSAKDAYDAQFATAQKGGFMYGDITYPFIL